jgi:hypothetical protein
MKNIWVLLYSLSLCFLFSAIQASKEVGCLCKDGTVQHPDCGICGSDMGIMEKTDTGVRCMCEHQLFHKEASCDEACKNNKGWTEKFD